MRNIIILSPLLLILPPVCGQVFSLRNVYFTQYNDKKTWEEAQSFCREKHIDLATIRSEEENQLFGGLEAWIGLNREMLGSWKWSSGDENATSINWNVGEPNNPLTELCVMRGGSGKWHNDNCRKKINFLCFDEKLVLVKENKTWEEALDHCRSLGVEDSEDPASVIWKPSCNLATLITDDDHSNARERAQQATTDEVWTGLRFQGNGWFWVGGEPVQYQDVPSCPAFGCGVLEKNSSTSFGIRACSQRRNFFCFKKP